MLRNQREKDFPTNQEGASPNGDHKANPSFTSSSRSSWSGMRNPRIVRVSRAFGGKDRHSKVTTVRGLRDRRVRLSVPTAIQLYDLQDRLGLNQPSKVVDWLINAAQHEIDKLPPLELPPEGFNIHGPREEGLTTQFSQRSKNQREEEKEKASEKCNFRGDFVSTQALLNNTSPSASNFYQWEGANVYLSQLGIRSASQSEASVMPIPYFCPPGIMPSIFPSHNVVATQMAEFNSNGKLDLANPTIEFGDIFS